MASSSSSFQNSALKRVLQWGLLAAALISSVSAQSSPTKLSTNPGYQGRRDACPERCSISGPSPGNWSLYHNFDQIQSCTQAVFYDFNLVDPVDDPNNPHRIYACTSYGPDWANLTPDNSTSTPTANTTTITSTYEIGWTTDNPGTLGVGRISNIAKQMGQYLAKGFAPTDRATLLFSQMGTISVGLYVGKGLQSQGIAAYAIPSLNNAIRSIGLNGTVSLALQFCQPGQDADHIFGLMVTGNKTFDAVQTALTNWSSAQCLTFPQSQYHNISGSVTLLTPLMNLTGTTDNSTSTSTSASISSTINAKTTSTSALKSVSSTLSSSLQHLSTSAPSTVSKRAFSGGLAPRADCRTIQVVSGDSCASLAKKCGISGADFTKYNPGKNFCSTLQPYQHVCCSSGTLPDFAPKPNSDGSCASYTVKSGDYCSAIAAKYSLTVPKLEGFNNNTWGFNGCTNLWAGTIICLSTGTPPMPAALANAVCGPQVPGTKKPAKGVDISTLNPCPLNACCDVWGQCGTTADFCTKSGTGAPGTAKPGTNGCISNCGTSLVRSAAPSVYRKMAFYEGFNLGRPCLYQDASQIDTSAYTHVFFAFGTLSTDFKVQVGDKLSKFEFGQFVRLTGVSKILSIGGWTFSTDPSTYSIFRNMVLPANQKQAATNIANFVKQYGLDGVNIDWEYPGAPDIPGIPAGSTSEGANYLTFLTTLRGLLPGKEVSIAAPASYWYLKAFPIAKMSKVLDYIIYMTYDLHGQWDSHNQWAQSGCPSGSCLRSDVNLTETLGALVMITKAGVPSNQVIVGVTSYGRSFAMAQAGCYGPQCQFLGSASSSQAKPGICTGTAGYIGNAEISAILSNSSRVTKSFVDTDSNSNILVYDKTQWVGYMDASTKASRQKLYASLDMGGWTDWAIDLMQYNDVPAGKSWAQFLTKVQASTDPFVVGPRTGNWTKLQCTDPSVVDVRDLSPEQRWDEMDCPDAWSNAITAWTGTDRPAGHFTFTESVSLSIHGPEGADCGSLLDTNNCDETKQCDGFIGLGSGPAGYEIWNSFVTVHEIYSSYNKALYQAAAGAIDNSLSAFENAFAPVPPPPDNTWLNILIACISLGTTMIAAPFFNSILTELPYFIEHAGTLATLKDTTYGAIGLSASVATNLAAGGSSGTWTVQKQQTFSEYMGQVITAWGNVTEVSLQQLFNGSDPSIKALSSLIVDGKLIEGNGRGVNPQTTPSTLSSLQASIAKAFFAYAIPSLWAVSGTHAFVLDSGYDCGTVDPEGQYLGTDTMHSTSGCYGGKLYYLVYPKGNAEVCGSAKRDTEICCGGGGTTCHSNYFIAPPGLDQLDGTAFGGIRTGDLIAGAVRTYQANGNANGAPVANPSNTQTFNDLYNQDVTTPGYIRIPVCSPDMAFTAWDNSNRVNTSSPLWPCLPLQGVTDCSAFTYQDATSDASPLVSDCQTIITNIQGTSGEWEVENAVGSQHQLVQFGTCKFGVQGKGKNGNIDFHVGSQDIVTLIQTAIQMYGGSGKVGASGYMTCNGDVKGQNVQWGLY